MPRSDLQFATRSGHRYTLLALLFINPVLLIGLGVALLVAGLGIPALVTYDPRDPADAHDLSIGSS